MPLTQQESTKLYSLLSLLIVFLALVLRIHHIDHESLFMDELRQVSYYSHSFSQIIQGAASQNQPPLDYWIGRVFTILSNSDFVARLPSALFGVSSVFVLMLMTARISTWPTALACGLVFALLPYHIYFSQHARPYSIAIFFTLAFIYSTYYTLTGTRLLWLKSAIFILTTTCFLYTRTLAPLVTVACVFSLLVTALVINVIGRRNFQGISSRRYILVLALIVISFSLYYPILLNILSQGARYANNAQSIEILSLISIITKLSLTPLWEAYVVQLDPVGPFLLPFILLAPILAWHRGLLKRNPLLLLVVILLPMVFLLNLVIFQAKTTFPFRPPYAIYLLPLCLILAATGIHLASTLPIFKGRLPHASLYFKISFLSLLVIFVLISLHDFKTRRINSDWKNLSAHLEKNYDDRHVLVFAGLMPIGNWEPTFYGFPRYYRGKSPLLGLNSVPQAAPDVLRLTQQPIFILFYYKNYFITSSSKYPIMPIPHKAFDISKLVSDTELNIHKFASFVILEPKNSDRNPSNNMQFLINQILKDIPDNFVLANFNYGLSSLKSASGDDDWEMYLDNAKQITPNYSIQKMELLTETIASYRYTKK